MCRDYVNEITEFSCKHVHIKNKENLNSLINRLVEGGARQLQVVSDFDKTITKQHENGKQHLSSFGNVLKFSKLPFRIIFFICRYIRTLQIDSCGICTKRKRTHRQVSSN